MADFEWSDYYELSQEIYSASKKDDPLYEARLRCVISRSYYAAWCSTKCFLEKRNGRPVGHNHVSVINEIRQLNCPEANFIHGHLDNLRNIRRAADYDLRLKRNIESEAKHVIKKAGEIISKLNKIR